MTTPYLGEIRLMSFGFAPKGWAMCNGQLLPINQNAALFSLLGTQYGGNGQTTFALPNLQGRSPLHMSPSYSLGQYGGEQGHTLSVSELPQHNHALTGSSSTGELASPAGNSLAAARGRYADSGDSILNGATLAPVGGGQAHLNMAPFLVLNMVIALQGVFPSQT